MIGPEKAWLMSLVGINALRSLTADVSASNRTRRVSSCSGILVVKPCASVISGFVAAAAVTPAPVLHTDGGAPFGRKTCVLSVQSDQAGGSVVSLDRLPAASVGQFSEMKACQDQRSNRRCTSGNFFSRSKRC